MAKSRQLAKLILIFALIFPAISYADSDDDNVIGWTQQVLLYTLTIDYKTTPDNFAERQKNFLPNAWNALRNFLNNKIQEVRNQKLSLHPILQGPATLINSGIFTGIRFWQINQTIRIPELSLTINFRLVIIKTNGPPFVVQSLSMRMN